MSGKKFGLDLTEGRVNTLLLRFAAPFLLANLVTVMYGIVGMIIVGQFTDRNVVSGVANGTQVTNLMSSFIVGIGTGGTVLIGRCIGARNDDGARKATGSLLIASAVVIALLTSVIGFGRESLLKLLNTTPEALPSARRYIQICTIGVPFNIGYGMLSAVARGMGNSKVPGLIAAACCMANIAIACVSVGVFGMAEAGAAMATVGAQIISCIAIAVWLYRKKLPFTFSARDIRPERKSIKPILFVGTPIVLQELLLTVSFMIVTGLVNSISDEAGVAVGVVASASVGVVGRAFSLSVVVPLSMNSAISAISAQSLGAGKPDRAFSTLKWGMLYSTLYAFVLIVICQLIPKSVAGVFTPDPVVVEAASGYLRSFCIDAFFIATVFCMNAYLSANGRSVVSMIHILVSTFLIRVPLSVYITGQEGVTMNDKLHMLGFASPTASTLSFTVCVVYILWFRKRQKAKAALGAAR